MVAGVHAGLISAVRDIDNSPLLRLDEAHSSPCFRSGYASAGNQDARCLLGKDIFYAFDIICLIWFTQRQPQGANGALCAYVSP